LEGGVAPGQDDFAEGLRAHLVTDGGELEGRVLLAADSGVRECAGLATGVEEYLIILGHGDVDALQESTHVRLILET
jgi:hypothetical protein